jgi:purine-binding chemotaxis protein CheW
MTDTTQVLTFSLGEEEYCVPINYVSEIVGSEQIQRVPNTEPHVEGVTDLRGETTTIIDPSELLSVDTEDLVTDGGKARNRIIILDEETVGADSPTGWLVSDVREVNEVSKTELDAEEAASSDYLKGFLKDDEDDRFTLWIDPHTFTA